MLTRTYISKINTIISGSTLNTGLNPVAELVYGSSITRILTYFDHTKLKKYVDEKVFPDINKLKHHLKITNACSLDFTQLHCSETSNISDSVKIRAASFDLLFFLIPQEWDSGKGFDYTHTFFNQGYYGLNCNGIMQDTSKFVSESGSNWYQSRNGFKWEEEGIYSFETLTKEYDNFSSSGGSNIIIGRQHFNIGNENIDIDITDVVNKFITGELKNNGIAIAFTPMLEATEDEIEHYVGFLTNKTNTFFEPFIETTYDDFISDDRSNFILDKPNKLYLYSNIGGIATNLDELPTCSINDKEYEVKQFSKGIYYIDVLLKSTDYQPNTMLYDVWDNIIYKGNKLNAVELDFVTKPNLYFFNVGKTLEENTKITPVIYGIQYDESIKRGDVRKLSIIPKVNYTKNSAQLINNMQARVYIKDGEREIDVMPFECVNKAYLENYFIIDTSILIPQQYYIDIKIFYNQEMIIHHNVLTFKIVDDLNNLYA